MIYSENLPSHAITVRGSGPNMRGIFTPMERKSLSKRLRFSIFTRDGYTCRYCGKQAGDVILHIDHIIPVSKGGTNDESNLITSCVDCNLGKSNIGIDAVAPTEMDRLRMIQEALEQRTAAMFAAECAKNKIQRESSLADFWRDLTGRDSVDIGTLHVVNSYLREYGEEMVYAWVAKAAMSCKWSDTAMGKYISGCKRKHIEQNEN